MPTVSDLHQELLSSGVAILGERGLDELSMRSIADAANCSTTAIVQRFGNKAGFLRAVVEFAMEQDRLFHDALLAQLSDAPLSFPYLSDLLISYIEQRSNYSVARVWAEILFGGNRELASSSTMKSWHQLRLRFWQTLFSRAGQENLHYASIVTTYTIMEEVFSFELFSDIEYRLLLKESSRALLAGLLEVDDSSGLGLMSVWATKNLASYNDFPERSVMARSISDNESAKKLLNIAAAEIFKYGIGSLNKRRVTKMAGMSSSMISYHFGNQADFINFAVWHTLWRDAPLEFRTPYEARRRQQNLSEWVEFMQWMTHPDAEDRPGGFYANFSRLTAQAGLQSGRRPPLRPLFQQLRRVDGWGSYEAGKTFWPTSLAVERGSAAAFGVWIKGAAAINVVFNGHGDICGKELVFLAKRLFAR